MNVLGLNMNVHEINKVQSRQLVITEKGWDMIASTVSIDLAIVYCSFQNCLVSSLRI